MNLTPLDWAVVGLFLAAILALGFSAKLRENSVLQFIAAGRALTLPVFVATLVSTWYGGILGIGESVQSYGIGTWVLMGVPYYVFALIYALVYAKKVRRAEEISIPERLERRFGKGVALVGGGLIFLLGVPAAHVLMLGVLAQSLTGWDLKVCIVVATIFGTLFLYKGGLLADARVSLLAFAMMYIGFAVIVVYCMSTHPIVATWQSIPDKNLFKWDGNQGWLTVVSFFILGAWTLIDPGFHQRVASAKSPEVGRRGIFVSIFFWFVFDMLMIVTGMYAIALMKELPTNKLLIYPLFGEQILPPGLKAVFFCGMLGTILTAMVGYSLVSGATLGRELVARLKPGTNDATVNTWSRYGIVAACLVAIVLAFCIESVVALWYAWGGAVIGAMLIPVSLAYGIGGKMRPPKAVVIVSMVVAFSASCAWMVYGFTHDNAYLTITIPTDIVIPFVRSRIHLVQEPTSFGLGTLAPGLFISFATLCLGILVKGKKGHEPVPD